MKDKLNEADFPSLLKMRFKDKCEDPLSRRGWSHPACFVLSDGTNSEADGRYLPSISHVLPIDTTWGNTQSFSLLQKSLKLVITGLTL